MGAEAVRYCFQTFGCVLEMRFPLASIAVLAVAVLEDHLVAADVAEYRLDRRSPAHSSVEDIRLGTRETKQQKTRLPEVVLVLQGTLRTQEIANCMSSDTV